jgi:hypothetical protein
MDNIRFLELSSYTKPEIKEVKNKNWVAYGEDNNYFQYLIDNFNGSPTNNAIINGIVQQIYGSGLDAKDKARKPDQWAELKSMVHPDCLRNAIQDLKITGQCALQVVYKKGKKSIAKIEHFPINTLRAERANEDGEIEGYYYHHNWEEVKPQEQPKRLPAFGTKNQELIEILYVKPYSLGYFYYSPVDYQGCLPYAELEQEVANYHINNVKNGLTAGALINFNNGVPDVKDQQDIERKITKKFSGTTNAGKFIVAFNDDKERAATIESLQLSDAHAQYGFLSDECTTKIMVGHRVTSPMLLGIKDQTGLGNNAEELKTAIALFEATVINPFRLLLIDALERVMSVNDMNLNLYFRTLSPFEEAAEQEAVQSETNLSDDRPFLNDDLAEDILKGLEGLGESEEDLLKDFDFVESEDVGEEPEDFDAEAYLNEREDFAAQQDHEVNLAAQQDSEQDSERYKVRYVYTKGTRKEPKGESRKLCKALLSANRVYRKEDIQKLSSKGGAQSKGQPYSVWLYKGGANCHHRWERRVYRKKLNKNGEAWGGGALSGTNKISVNDAIRQGFKLPKNPKTVAIAPIDTPSKGYKS